MKKIKTVKFDIGVAGFATEKEITPELIAEYIEQESPGVYNELRVENGSVVYNGTNGDPSDWTTTVGYLATTHNLF